MTAGTPLDREALQAAVSCLPRVSRSVFLLHATEDVPLVEIAVRLGLTPREVEHQLARALAEIDRQTGTISPTGGVASDSADR